MSGSVLNISTMIFLIDRGNLLEANGGIESIWELRLMVDCRVAKERRLNKKYGAHPSGTTLVTSLVFTQLFWEVKSTSRGA